MRALVLVVFALLAACAADPPSTITIEPAEASVEILNGAIMSPPAFVAIVDGHPATVAWSIDDTRVASIDDAGTVTPTGALGGIVQIDAALGDLHGTARLVVKLHQIDSSGDLTTAQRVALLDVAPTLAHQPASQDPAIAWAYPYDGTVFPRGLAAPTLMWNGGVEADWYYVHVTTETYELETFEKLTKSIDELVPISRYRFPQQRWSQLADSSSGTVAITVTRLPAGASVATGVVRHEWKIAPADLPGTIYYWTQKTETGSLAGRLKALDLASGTTVDYFGDLRPTGVESCPKCHTPSADGRHMAFVMANETNLMLTESVTYDLAKATPEFVGYPTGGEWGAVALSSHGDVLVQNFGPIRAQLALGGTSGAFDAKTGVSIANTGLESIRPWMPAFAPDDSMLVYVDESTPNCPIDTGQGPTDGPKVKLCAGDLRVVDWDATTRRATNARTLAAKGADPARDVIQYPTVSPDHSTILFGRGPQLGSFSLSDTSIMNTGDFFAVSPAGGAEVDLANLDGDAYPFAAGERDRHLSYDASFAPVTAGGYAWVVFVSRRTYGNLLVGPAFTSQQFGTKQLWVAAIDLSAPPGTDPSHAAFWLPGQDFSATELTVINQRPRWTLSPGD